MFDIAIILFLCLFFAIFFVRTLMLRKQSIKFFMFAKTDKNDFILAPIMILYIYSMAASATNLPFPSILKTPIFQSIPVSYIGFFLSLAGLFLYIWTLVSFKNSFRVGIDTKNPGSLITSGAFAVSRNPIYVSFAMLFLGILLMHPNIAVIFFFFCIFSPAIYRQTLREERFMREHYGQEYEEYAKKVRRFI